MSRTFIKLTLACSLYSVFIIGANAATPQKQKADSNQNGLIEQSEFTALAQKRFILMDTDKNGQVTIEERLAYLGVKRGERIQKRFSKADSNQDGVLTREEVTKAYETRKQLRKSRRAERRADKGRVRIRPDSNKDGVMDTGEYDAFVKAQFNRLDIDGNGVIDQDERKLGKHDARKKRRGLGR